MGAIWMIGCISKSPVTRSPSLQWDLLWFKLNMWSLWAVRNIAIFFCNLDSQLCHQIHHDSLIERKHTSKFPHSLPKTKSWPHKKTWTQKDSSSLSFPPFVRGHVISKKSPRLGSSIWTPNVYLGICNFSVAWLQTMLIASNILLLLLQNTLYWLYDSNIPSPNDCFSQLLPLFL